MIVSSILNKMKTKHAVQTIITKEREITVHKQAVLYGFGNKKMSLNFAFKKTFIVGSSITGFSHANLCEKPPIQLIFTHARLKYSRNCILH